MRSPSSLFLLATLGMLAGCIFPDIGIEVYSTQECGWQYRASTNGAFGLTGAGEHHHIEIDGLPITKTWCLSPEQAELMQFDDSWVYQELHDDIVATCKARANELQLGNENCTQSATIAASGPCPGKHEWCEDETSGDEVGAPDLPPE